jgi:hypothetical protein
MLALMMTVYPEYEYTIFLIYYELYNILFSGKILYWYEERYKETIKNTGDLI